MAETPAGPTGYVVVTFADPAGARAGFERLAALAESGAVALHDVEFLHSIRGIASTFAPGAIDPALASFDHADARLLSQADLDLVVESLGRHEVAAVVVFAGSAFGEVLDAWDGAGVRITSRGAVDDDVLTADPDAVGPRVLRHRTT